MVKTVYRRIYNVVAKLSHFVQQKTWHRHFNIFSFWETTPYSPFWTNFITFLNNYEHLFVLEWGNCISLNH